MKQLVQACLGALGYRIVRVRNAIPPLQAFFSLLKARGFTPKHIVDVGANHGDWTRTALRFFPEAHYTLVEPQDHLKVHVHDLLGNGKIHWIGAGAADKPGTLPFGISERDDSSSFVNATGTRRQIEVPVTTLNEIVQGGGKPIPDMVKIDAEGFDLKVLAGASELLGKTDIFLLEVAICERGFETTLENVVRAMAKAGYRVLDFTDLNRSPKFDVLWVCEVAFLRNASHLLDGVDSYE